MPGVLVGAAVVVAILELVVFALLSDWIGVLPTFLALVFISVVGALVMVRQGIVTLRRLLQAMRRREMPTDELADAALIALGGAFLLSPGFVTDLLAFVVVLPPTRRPLRAVVKRITTAVATSRFGWVGRAGVASGKVHDVDARTVGRAATPGPDPGAPPRPLPSPPRPSGEDGSPDTG